MSSRDLEKLLGALREETRGVEAPPHVEAALRSAFRAQVRTPARRGWMAWALSAAAAVTVVIGGGAWKLNQPVASLPLVRLAVAPPPAIAQTVAARPAKRIRRRPVVPVKREAPPAPEVATDFMPIEDTVALPPIESGQVLRVSMPRATMMRFGFPVNPDRMLEPVKADVVFGQDGIARAVRFVR